MTDKSSIGDERIAEIRQQVDYRLSEIERLSRAIREQRKRPSTVEQLIIFTESQAVHARRELAALTTLQAEVEARPSQTRFVWLMERPGRGIRSGLRQEPQGMPVYWDGGHAESWTADPHKAVQWPSKDAAMQRCPPEHYAQWGWKYVEHGFIAEVEAREPAAQQTNEATIQRLLADPVRQECDSLKEQRDTWHANYLAAEQLRQSAEAIAHQIEQRAETAEQALEAEKAESAAREQIIQTIVYAIEGKPLPFPNLASNGIVIRAQRTLTEAQERITALEGALRAKVQEWRTQIHHETPPLNAIQAGSWDTKRQCADELDALLTPSAGSPDSKRSTE
jgi:hypothetical protein